MFVIKFPAPPEMNTTVKEKERKRNKKLYKDQEDCS